MLKEYFIALGILRSLHLLFIDNYLFTERATAITVLEFRKILRDYCLSSSEIINFFKSKVHFSPKTSTRLRHLIQDIFGFTEHGGALLYLDVSITGGRLLKADCGQMVRAV